MIRKALLVILASVAVAQASAETTGGWDTGNDWLGQVQSDVSSQRLAAFAYLVGMHHIHRNTGLWGECVPTPDGVTYGQIEAVVIKWLEDNPGKRHLDMVGTLHVAKEEVWGSYPLPADKGIC